MNRNLIIAVVVVIVLAAGGFFLVSNSKKTVAPSSTSGNVQAPTSGNAITSIKDALSKSVSLECTYTDEKGTKTVARIKNGAVRADITSSNENESGSVIVKDKKMYFWNKTSVFMMDLSATEVTGTPQNGQSQGQNQEKDLMAGLEKYKDNCKPAVVSDSLFTPPSDVKFQDFSQMLKDAQKAMPTIDAKQYQQILQQLTPSPTQ